MIFDGEFFSGAHLRWNLGWPTPNYAGAFLVTLLALAFVFSGSRWRRVYFAAEAGGLFLLAKTYSRGAVIAWGSAWLFAVLASRGWRGPAERLVWAARVIVLVVMILVSGFVWSRVKDNGGRIKHGTLASIGPTREKTAQVEKKDLASAAEDGSIVNRLTLWQGGLKMIAVGPLSGWGAGESGRAYMNWYQDMDHDEGYATMVNSYLHVAVEHGLPVLAAVLWIVAWLLLAAWRGARGDAPSESSDGLGEPRTRTIQQMGSMAAGSSLVAWLAANVFTTLWIEPKLWIVPAIACLVVVRNAWKDSCGRFVSLTFSSLAMAVLAVAGLYGAGRWLLGRQALVFTPGANGSVVRATDALTRASWHAWTDPVVLGSTPGKELRRWLETSPADIGLVVHRAAPLQPGEIPTEATGILLFGRQADRIAPDFPADCRELWLIHPTVPPPAAGKSPKPLAEVTTLILPQIDETGNGPAWREWAKQTGARIMESPACGLDIRAAWPGILPLPSRQVSVKGAAMAPSPASRESL